MSNINVVSYKDKVSTTKSIYKKYTEKNNLDKTIVTFENKTYLQHRQKLTALFLTVESLKHNFKTSVKLTPAVISSTPHSDELVEFFFKEYESLPLNKKILELDSIIKNVPNDFLELFKSVGLGNLDRVREYSNNSIQDILQSRFFDIFANLEYYWFEFIAPLINNEIEEPKQEVKKTNKKVKKDSVVEDAPEDKNTLEEKSEEDNNQEA